MLTLLQASSSPCLSQYSSVLVVFSVTDPISLVRASHILSNLSSEGDLTSKAVILVGNKTDLVRTRVVTSTEGRALAISHDCKYVEVSAALDHHVDTLLVGIVKQIRLKALRETVPAKIYAR